MITIWNRKNAFSHIFTIKNLDLLIISFSLFLAKFGKIFQGFTKHIQKFIDSLEEKKSIYVFKIYQITSYKNGIIRIKFFSKYD